LTTTGGLDRAAEISMASRGILRSRSSSAELNSSPRDGELDRSAQREGSQTSERYLSELRIREERVQQAFASQDKRLSDSMSKQEFLGGDDGHSYKHVTTHKSSQVISFRGYWMLCHQ